jgi:hypothetical protein
LFAGWFRKAGLRLFKIKGSWRWAWKVDVVVKKYAATGGSPESMARGYKNGRYVGTADKMKKQKINTNAAMLGGGDV